MDFIDYIDFEALSPPIQSGRITVQVSFTGGFAGATSVSDSGHRKLGFAFDGNSSTFWRSPLLRPSLPSYIWYDFKNRSIKPAAISFRPRPAGYWGLRQYPSKFQFVGSNDEICTHHSNWSVICEDLSGVRVASIHDTKGCRVEMPPPLQTFRCLGLKALAVGDNMAESGATALRDITIWQF